jgi:DnaJ-class molecular chaperone
MNMDEVVCFVCGETGHFAKKCKNHKGKKNQQGQKSANVTIGDPSRSRYGNSLPSVFSVCQSND